MSESYQRFYQNALDLMVEMAMCHRVPGPLTFLVNVEKQEWPGDKAMTI